MMKRLQLVLLALALSLMLVGSVTAQGNADTLVVAINSDVQGFSAFAQTSVTNFVTSFLWPSLWQSDPQTGVMQPNLASWTVSEDGRTYTFTINPDANWSDGTPITSNDVKFTLEAINAPEVGSFMAGSIIYESINIIDDKTFEIVTPEVDCTFLNSLLWGVVPAHKFAPDFSDFNTAAINTAPDISGGPYIFDEHSPDEFIRMRANPEYWKGEPNIPNLIFQIIPDTEIQLQSLLNGDIDYAPLTTDQAPIAQGNPDVTVFSIPINGYYYVSLNIADPANPQPALDEEGNAVDQGGHPLFGDPSVRRAVIMGYDHDAAVGLVGEGAVRVTGPIPPVVSWAYNSGLAPIPYDPEGAAALLEEAGWIDTDGDGVREKDGVPLAFQLDYVAGNVTLDSIALVIQDQLSQIGFQVNLSSGESQSQLGTRFLPQVYDAFLLQVAAGTTPDPNFLLSFTHTGAQDIPGAGLNAASYYNPRMDELIAEARTVPGCAEADRAPVYHEIHELAQQDAAYDYLYSGVAWAGYNNRIQGIAPGPWGIWYNIQEWTLEG